MRNVNLFLLALFGVLLWLLLRKKEDDGFSLDDDFKEPKDKPDGDFVGGGGSFGGGGASGSWLTGGVPEIKMPPALVIPVDVPVSVAGGSSDYEHSAINETGQAFKKLPFSRFREMEEKFV